MAQNNWTVAASTGIADEESRRFLVFGRLPPEPVLAPIGGVPSPLAFTSSEDFGTEDSVVSLVNNAQKGSYGIRYHVPLEPITQLRDRQTLFMQVRYLVDDLELGRVVVLLKKYSFVSPPSSERAQILSVFDSKDQAPSNSFQLRGVSFEDDLNDPDFAYFIEALLINNKEPSPFGSGISLPNSTHPSPAIAAIRLATEMLKVIN